MKFILNSIAVIATVSVQGYKFMHALGYVLIILGTLLVVSGAFMSLRSVKSRKELSKKGRFKKGKGLILSAESLLGDREYQQDYFIYPRVEYNELTSSIGKMAIVCDGMGGLEGGARASRLCAELVYKGFYQIGSTENICHVLSELVLDANTEITNLVGDDGRKLNSGTTIVAAVVSGNTVSWVSAGDSRIYLYHDRRLMQITRDHNYRITLRERYNAGLITQAQIESDPQRDALISYVGRGETIIIDSGTINFDSKAGDILVLCSDGLYKYLSDEKILELIHSNAKRPNELAAILAKAALNENGRKKHDNITVLTVSG